MFLQSRFGYVESRRGNPYPGGEMRDARPGLSRRFTPRLINSTDAVVPGTPEPQGNFRPGNLFYTHRLNQVQALYSIKLKVYVEHDRNTKVRVVVVDLTVISHTCVETKLARMRVNALSRSRPCGIFGSTQGLYIYELRYTYTTNCDSTLNSMHISQ